jgi:RNA polymerase sigma factor (sigma-70 family)
MVRNLGYDYRREQARGAPFGTEEIVVEDRALRDAERGRIVATALETLSSRDRELLRRRYFQGQSYNEIAEDLGITVNNAGVALHRAEKRLKKLLEDRL